MEYLFSEFYNSLLKLLCAGLRRRNCFNCCCLLQWSLNSKDSWDLKWLQKHVGMLVITCIVCRVIRCILPFRFPSLQRSGDKAWWLWSRDVFSIFVHSLFHLCFPRKLGRSNHLVPKSAYRVSVISSKTAESGIVRSFSDWHSPLNCSLALVKNYPSP